MSLWLCVLLAWWRCRCWHFAPVDCISLLSGSMEWTLCYTMLDIRCRHRCYMCDWHCGISALIIIQFCALIIFENRKWVLNGLALVEMLVRHCKCCVVTVQVFHCSTRWDSNDSWRNGGERCVATIIQDYRKSYSVAVWPCWTQITTCKLWTAIELLLVSPTLCHCGPIAC